MSNRLTTEELVRRAAAKAGFAQVGFARTADFSDTHGERLDAFIADERYGDMDWMPAQAHRRRHPQAMWPEARSAVVLGFNYGPDTNPLDALAHKERGVISVYARGRDYHDVVKGRLKDVAGVLARATNGADVKVFVDTAPLMEKPLAALAGLGWQGRHTNLVSREAGSWLFLGVILTTAELKPDAPIADNCGSCRRCLDICPTQAFLAPYQLDARRCISYLTIEHKGPIARELRALMGNRIYGCDDCLAICPWNKFAAVASEARLAATDATRETDLADLLSLDDATFRQRFSGSPIKRSGRNRFLRNVLIAAGNAGTPSLLPAVERCLTDDSSLVRGAAVWAVARLGGVDLVRRLADRYLAEETDETVRAEWHEELAE
ncbi:MAG: tRNA epoxyqueuosine(34) reductase QueG [Hyphomicrobiaceae bacterium]